MTNKTENTLAAVDANEARTLALLGIEPAAARTRKTRARVTRDEWQIWGNYGYGWDEECSESTRKEGLARLREYRADGGGTYELRKRRVRIAGPQS